MLAVICNYLISLSRNEISGASLSHSNLSHTHFVSCIYRHKVGRHFHLELPVATLFIAQKMLYQRIFLAFCRLFRPVLTTYLEYMTRKLKETYNKWGLDMNLNKTKYLCIGQTYSYLKLDKESEIEFCQKYKYLGVIFDTSGTDDKEIRSRVIEARKCIACLNGILWSKDIRKEITLNIYNALIKSSLLYGSETRRLTENNKRRDEATEMDALRRP